MKLISLNTWGGKVFDPLINFIGQHSTNTDIFCFQEIQNTISQTKQYKGIRANLLEEIKRILIDFEVFYFPSLYGFDDQPEKVEFDLSAGNAIFYRNISVKSRDNIFLNGDASLKILKKDFSNRPTPLQYIEFNKNEKGFFIFNLHGTPFPGNKLDTSKRIEQSEKILDIMDSKNGAKILVGDFNLLPETESIKMIENKGYKNLIKEFNIDRTRSSLSPYWKDSDFQKFADYTFVSREVKIKSFRVPHLEISDHLPMVLEFDIS